MSDIFATVTGIPLVVKGLVAEGARMTRGGVVGLEVSARVLRDRARAKVAGHHYTGRLARSIEVGSPHYRLNATLKGDVQIPGMEAESVKANVEVGVARGGSLESGGAMLVEVPVGIKAGEQVPEARMLRSGWRSSSGSQPPNGALAAWIRTKNLAANDKDAERAAFAVARQIKNEGVKTEKKNFLGEAAAEVAPTVEGTVGRFIK